MSEEEEDIIMVLVLAFRPGLLDRPLGLLLLLWQSSRWGGGVLLLVLLKAGLKPSISASKVGTRNVELSPPERKNIYIL